MAADDFNSVNEAFGTGSSGVPTGNVINGRAATPTPTAFTLTISAVRTGGKWHRHVRKRSATALAGAYGTLTLNPGGSYNYVLDNENPDVDALNATETLTDVFTYTVTDETGQTDTAQLHHHHQRHQRWRCRQRSTGGGRRLQLCL